MEFLTTTEVAKMLNISRQAVLKRINEGTLKAHKIGRNFVINKTDLPFLGELKDEEREELKKAVKRVAKEYEQTLKLLGKE